MYSMEMSSNFPYFSREAGRRNQSISSRKYSWENDSKSSSTVELVQTVGNLIAFAVDMNIIVKFWSLVKVHYELLGCFFVQLSDVVMKMAKDIGPFLNKASSLVAFYCAPQHLVLLHHKIDSNTLDWVSFDFFLLGLLHSWEVAYDNKELIFQSCVLKSGERT